jgi:hypothetical protein
MEGLALLNPNDALTPFWKPLFIDGVDVEKGIARQLNPAAFYCAMRWDYSVFSRARVAQAVVRVQSGNGSVIWARPVDWGPNEKTGRLIDLSPGALRSLGIVTDSSVCVEVVL